MAHIHKGQLTAAKEWWVHLRHTKRDFWKGERKAARLDVLERLRVE